MDFDERTRRVHSICSGGRTRTPKRWTRTSSVANYTTSERHTDSSGSPNPPQTTFLHDDRSDRATERHYDGASTRLTNRRYPITRPTATSPVSRASAAVEERVPERAGDTAPSIPTSSAIESTRYE